MNITDKQVKHQLKLANISELTELVENYPDDEIDGRSELDILKNEAYYLYDMFNECGTVFYDDLNWAREMIKETKNGTVFHGLLDSRQLALAKIEVDKANNTLNEYKRLCNLIKRLKKL